MTKKNLLIFSIFIPVVSFIAYFSLVGSPIFDTNDDVVMAMISAGVLLTPKPSSSLSFIHPFYGKLLQTLYTVNNNIPWYGVLFILVSFLSLSILNFSFLRLVKKNNARFYIHLALLINLFITFPILYRLQFTVIASISILAGFLLLLSILLQYPRNKILFLTGFLTSLGVILIGAMIRIQSFYMICIIIAPVTLLLLLRVTLSNGKKRDFFQLFFDFLIRSLPYFIIAFSIAILSLTYSSYYGSNGWQNWLNINNGVRPIVDYRLIQYNDQNKPIFQKLGWSKTDYEMLASWQYLDVSHFPAEKFKRFNDSITVKQSFDLSTVINRLRLHVRRVLGETVLGVPFLSLAIVSLIILSVSVRSNTLEPLYTAFTLTGFVFQFVYCAVILDKTTLRTDFPALVAVVYTLLFLQIFNNSDSGKKVGRSIKDFYSLARSSKFILMLTTLIVLLWFKYDVSNDISRVHSHVDGSKNFQENVLKVWRSNLPRNSIIYSVGSSFPYEYYLPLDNLRNFDLPVGFVSAGWMNQSPVQLEVLTSLGLGKNFYLSLINKEFVYVTGVCSQKENWVLQNFYKEKYGINIKFDAPSDLPGLCRMYATD